VALGAAAGGEWFRREFGRKYEEASREIGRFNLGVFGKTGVGKSTLINAIFGKDVAATGIGEPVTQGSHLYLHAAGHFGVIDTQGLEIGKDDATILRELESYVLGLRGKPLSEQLHVAWYCVRAMDRRFEETEAEFIRALDRLGIPVLLVFTQVPMRRGHVHPDALTLRTDVEQRELPLRGEPVFLTYAKADEFHDLQVHGLQELLDATFRRAPEGVTEALTAAQKIDRSRKRTAAERAIAAAVTTAGAAGATPIPFSDAAVIVPVQLTMMASIANTYDVDIDKATTAALAATAGATAAGRSLVTGLLKMVPGIGSVVGGAISAGVASALTWSIGHAWVVVCVRLADGKLRSVSGALDTDAIRDLFMNEFRGNVRRRLPGGGAEGA
jgi:uncharacterized protein (DUF697 family)/GTPase SAR1 family protein